MIDPFLDHYPRNRRDEPQFLTTPAKVRDLKEMLGAVDQAAVSETLDWFVHASVRNGFAQADYTLHSDEFRANGRSRAFASASVQQSCYRECTVVSALLQALRLRATRLVATAKPRRLGS